MAERPNANSRLGKQVAFSTSKPGKLLVLYSLNTVPASANPALQHWKIKVEHDMTNYWTIFAELISKPFEDVTLIWGIVPLYFALLLNEMTSEKANFQTALQTGFSFLWASAQWIYPYFRPHGPNRTYVAWDAMMPINLCVTVLVLAFGVIALVSGIRKKYPKYGAFLGRTRFSNYFMITIYPMQSHYPGFNWTWDRLTAIALFALPVWLLLHFGLMPLRNR